MEVINHILPKLLLGRFFFVVVVSKLRYERDLKFIAEYFMDAYFSCFDEL